MFNYINNYIYMSISFKIVFDDCLVNEVNDYQIYSY